MLSLPLPMMMMLLLTNLLFIHTQMLILHESHDQLNWNENIRYFFYTAHLIAAQAMTTIVKDGHNSAIMECVRLSIKHGLYTHGLCETVKMRWERNDADEPQQLQYQDEENDVAHETSSQRFNSLFQFLLHAHSFASFVAHTFRLFALSVRCLWVFFNFFTSIENRWCSFRSIAFTTTVFVSVSSFIYLFDLPLIHARSCRRKKKYLLLLRLSLLLILV